MALLQRTDQLPGTEELFPQIFLDFRGAVLCLVNTVIGADLYGFCPAVTQFNLEPGSFFPDDNVRHLVFRRMGGHPLHQRKRTEPGDPLGAATELGRGLPQLGGKASQRAENNASSSEESPRRRSWKSRNSPTLLLPVPEGSNP